jgi:triosephosphate isomerase
MRKKIVAGNWKMNMTLADGEALVEEIMNKSPELDDNKQVIFCTPFTHLMLIDDTITELSKPNFFLGAQNCNNNTSGAYTGEISISMLEEVGVDAVIIGHSERRQYYAESNEFLKSKVDALVENDLQVIFCCGESLEIREANTQNEFVAKQLEESLFHLDAAQMLNNVVIAYEPIWAIGTGKTATTAQAQEMHSYIRSLIASKYNNEIAQEISILYGGSCNATNAKELFACEDVDGGLIGGAALKADTFLPIIEAMF